MRLSKILKSHAPSYKRRRSSTCVPRILRRTFIELKWLRPSCYDH